MKPIIKFSAFLLLNGILFFISCKEELSCEACLPAKNSSANKPPMANAGTGQKTTLPKDSILLDGTASTDADGSIVSYKWLKGSGPISSIIIVPDSSRTWVKALTAGVYQFVLTVEDNGGLTANDTVEILVNDPAINQPPIAVAGANQTITLPINTVTLNGSASNDPDG